MPIAVDGPAMLTGDTARIRALFHLEHEQRYGQAAIEEELEIVNMRLVLTAERADTRAETWLAEPWQPEARRRRRDARRDLRRCERTGQDTGSLAAGALPPG